MNLNTKGRSLSLELMLSRLERGEEDFFLFPLSQTEIGLV